MPDIMCRIVETQVKTIFDTNGPMNSAKPLLWEISQHSHKLAAFKFLCCYVYFNEQKLQIPLNLDDF